MPAQLDATDGPLQTGLKLEVTLQAVKVAKEVGLSCCDVLGCAVCFAHASSLLRSAYACDINADDVSDLLVKTGLACLA